MFFTTVNFIVGIDSATPADVVNYIMALDSVRVVNGDILNFRLQSAYADLMFGGGGADSATPKDVAYWIMGVTQDPSADGNWTIYADLYGNTVCNYRPQIGWGGS